MVRKTSIFLVFALITSLFSVNNRGSASLSFAGEPAPAVTPATASAEEREHIVPPSPSALSPEAEQDRARQAMEAVLQKYLRYQGPRYQVAPLEVLVEGEWAYGVARWQSEARTLSGPIHILARRMPNGAWQALMPSSEGLYRQWIDAIPTSLVPAGKKDQLRAQAAEADALWQAQATSSVPQALTVTPSPSFKSASSVVWSVEGDRSVIYAVTNKGTRTKVVDTPFDVMLLPQFSVFITLSPDGRYITYVTAENLVMHNAQLWIFDISINSQRLLATFPYDLWIAPLVWSPDGTRIAFTKVTTPSLTNSGIELWAFNVQSGEQTMLVSDPSFRPDLFRVGSLPVVHWSPDGTSIVYIDYTAKDGFMTKYEANLASGVIHSSRHPLSPAEQSRLSTLATLPCGVTQFSQNDPEWRNDVMRTCDLTIGAAGCAVTAVAMTFRYYGVETSPRTLNQCLGNSACPIYWGTAASSCSGSKVSYLGSPGFAWSTIESNLSAGRPVIIELLKGGNSHYVVAVSGNGSNGSGYIVNDPWDGQVKSLAAYTGNGWTPTGLRIYGGTPWCQNVTCDATSLPSGYAKCADEGSRCNFSGTQQVYYGANSCYKVRSFTNGVDCNNSNFGDPVFGVQKACYIPSSTSTCNPNADQVALYANTGWGGNCVTLGVGQYPNPGHLGSVGNDNAESIRVGGNVRAILYEHDNYQGRSETFTDDDSNLGDNHIGANSVSSVKVEWRAQSCNPNADQIALYANTGWGGSCVVLGVGEYPNPGHFASLGNDNAESIRVGSNVQAILYEHDNYQGRAETFTGDDSNLGDNYIGANSVSSVKVQPRAQPPAPPQLQAPANGSVFNEGQAINLAWSSTSNEYYGEVWGGPGGTLTFGWQSATNKNLGAQWAGYTYSWRVRARNGTGESGWSSTWTFTVKPAAPSNLSAQAASCSQVNLYWTDNSGNEEGYKIYRNGAYVAQVGMNATSYQDTGLSGNTSYTYQVRAFRGGIESEASNTVNITTPSCSQSPQTFLTFIPLVRRSEPSLLNGSFEQGPTGWTEYSTNGWSLIMHSSDLPVTPRSGSWAVWLGGGNNEISYISQYVRVPNTQPYLTYWHWIFSTETECYWDYGKVLVNGAVVSQYGLCASTNTGGWVPYSVNLTAYSGQLISLQIRAETDFSNFSSIYVDDVSFSSMPLLHLGQHSDVSQETTPTHRRIK